MTEDKAVKRRWCTDGSVIWITGLSRSGKTTVARRLNESLQELGLKPILIDGDKMRELIPFRSGFSADERMRCAMFYSRLAEELSEQKHIVICSTISLFKTIHQRNRRCIKEYLEVFLRVPLDELQHREGGGLYTGESSHNGNPVVGKDIEPEFPENPDIVIENWGDTTPGVACNQILTVLARRLQEEHLIHELSDI